MTTTIGTNPDCPGGIQLLADHLDTALAVGEDLLAMVLPPRADLDEADPATAPEAMDRFVRRAAELEIALLVRVLQARRRAGEIGRDDAALKVAAGLFQAQTALLLDLIEGADRQYPGSLGGMGDGIAYLRSRGLLAPDSAAPSPFESIAVCEDFRIGGVARLGDLLDVVSALLDLLDARFGLYAVAPDDAVPDAPDVEDVAVSSDADADEPVVPVKVDGPLPIAADDEPASAATTPETAAGSDVTAREPASDPAPQTLANRLQQCAAADMEQPT